MGYILKTTYTPSRFVLLLYLKSIYSLEIAMSKTSLLQKQTKTLTAQTLGEETPELKVFFASKCFDQCVESFKDKFLNPYEKECMGSCLSNMRAFYIQTKNGYNTSGK